MQHHMTALAARLQPRNAQAPNALLPLLPRPPLQVFASGTDELLELCKAVYELHVELGMGASGQDPQARPRQPRTAFAALPPCCALPSRRPPAAGLPHFLRPACSAACWAPPAPAPQPARRPPLPRPALQPWDGQGPYAPCDDDDLVARSRSVMDEVHARNRRGGRGAKRQKLGEGAAGAAAAVELDGGEEEGDDEEEEPQGSDAEEEGSEGASDEQEEDEAEEEEGPDVAGPSRGRGAKGEKGEPPPSWSRRSLALGRQQTLLGLQVVK